MKTLSLQHQKKKKLMNLKQDRFQILLFKNLIDSHRKRQ